MGNWIETIKSTWIWAAGVATAVISGLIVEYTKEYPIPGAIWGAICYLWDGFIILMTIDIKLWWILISIVIMFVLRYVFNNTKITKANEVYTAKKINTGGTTQQPKFLSYTKECVDGIPWEWEWEKNNGQWQVQSLQPHCPKDGGRLMQFSNDCPICNSNYFGVVNGDKAAAIIELKIKELLKDKQ